MTYQLYLGDCLQFMRTLDAGSIDAVVTNPPYGLKFMGKDWDHGIPGVHFWQESLRVVKPGAHLLAFGGTRTHHRLMCAIEDAGWEIRDTIMWVYGSGFPKSHNLKDEWDGWGTALKPAWEPIIVARKPLEGTVAQNVTRYGTGAINIDACRVGTGNDRSSGGLNSMSFNTKTGSLNYRVEQSARPTGSRWPANLIHDGSAEVLRGFPVTMQNGYRANPSHDSDDGSNTWSLNRTERGPRGHNDTGSAARFFYCAKASKADRDEGCEELELKPKPSGGHGNDEDDPISIALGSKRESRNNHPTVKPTTLMRYLVRLVTPPNGIAVDWFMGSGSTGKAAMLEGFNFIGCEIHEPYFRIAEKRIADAAAQPPLFTLDAAAPQQTALEFDG